MSVATIKKQYLGAMGFVTLLITDVLAAPGDFGKDNVDSGTTKTDDDITGIIGQLTVYVELVCMLLGLVALGTAGVLVTKNKYTEAKMAGVGAAILLGVGTLAGFLMPK